MSRFLAVSTANSVRTLRMNNPQKLNAWTRNMLVEIQGEMKQAQNDDKCKVVVITGTDPYYCAGVELNALFKPMSPKTLRNLIIESNQALFDTFLNFKKPIIVAVNGPAIGASVTSATLCDAIVASEKASFLTPFARLGVPPEGCSSVHLGRLIGSDAAHKMLKEDWKVSSEDAKRIGLVTEVVKHEELESYAQRLGENWIADGSYLERRSAMGFKDFDMLREVNQKESVDLADAFLSTAFLDNQYKFLMSKNKTVPAMVFKTVVLTRPIWSKFL